MGRGFLGSILFIACCVTDIRLIRDYFATSQLPLWDPAEYTWVGRKMGFLFSQGDFLTALGILNQHTFHPPFHALVSVPFHLIVSDHYLAAMLVNWMAWIWIRGQIWWMGLKLDRDSNHRLPWIAFFATASINSSLLFREFANVVNLELLGALIVMITIDQYSSILTRCTHSVNAARLTGLGIALAFFTKYNFVLFVVPVILFFEWIRTSPHMKDRRMFTGEDRWIAGIFMGLSCMGWFVARHPGRLESVSVRGIANLLYGVVLFRVLYGTVMRYSRSRDSLGGHSSTKTDDIASPCVIWRWSVVPILIWLLIPVPNRFFDLIRFFSNRSSPLALLDHISYYFRQAITGATGSDLMGWMLLLGFFLGILAILRKTHTNSRSAVWIVMSGLSLAIITCHSYKLPRLFIPVIPMLTLGSFSEWFRLARKRTCTRWMGILVLFGMFFYHSYAIVSSEAPNRCRQHYAPSKVADVLEYLNAAISIDQDTLIVGTLNELSPGLIISYVLEQKGSIPSVQFELPLLRDLNRSDVASEGSMERYAEKLDQTLQRSSFDLIIVIVLKPSSPFSTTDWIQWNAWKEKYGTLIRNHRQCKRVSTATFDDIGISIESYIYHLEAM